MSVAKWTCAVLAVCVALSPTALCGERTKDPPDRVIEVEARRAAHTLALTLLKREDVVAMFNNDYAAAELVFRDYSEAVGSKLDAATRALDEIAAGGNAARAVEAVRDFGRTSKDALNAAAEAICQLQKLEQSDAQALLARTEKAAIREWLRDAQTKRPDPDGRGVDVERLVALAMSPGGELARLGEATREAGPLRLKWAQLCKEHLAALHPRSCDCIDDVADFALLAVKTTSALFPDPHAVQLRISQHRQLWARENDRFVAVAAEAARNAGCTELQVQRWWLRYLRRAYPAIVPQVLPCEAVVSLVGLSGTAADREEAREASEAFQLDHIPRWHRLADEFIGWWWSGKILGIKDGPPPQRLVDEEAALRKAENAFVVAFARSRSSQILRRLLEGVANERTTTAISYMAESAELIRSEDKRIQVP